MMPNSKSILTTVFVPTTLVLAMFITGCSSDKSTTNSQAPAVDPSVLADTQELVVNNGTEPESLDPHKVSGVPESNLNQCTAYLARRCQPIGCS